VRPFDYTKLVTILSAAITGATILKLSFNTLKPAIYSRNLWSAISLILILLFTSGHMFNHIRKVPYVANNGKGGVSYVAGGFSNQYGLETQIVAVICTSFIGIRWT
jgi:oligosaccharyltransferase complex subunit gamma